MSTSPQVTPMQQPTTKSAAKDPCASASKSLKSDTGATTNKRGKKQETKDVAGKSDQYKKTADSNIFKT